MGDSLIYLAGRRVGRRVRTGHGWLARVVTPAAPHLVEGLFARHGEKIVIAARFMPGVRAVTYFTAGSAGMPYRPLHLLRRPGRARARPRSSCCSGTGSAGTCSRSSS